MSNDQASEETRRALADMIEACVDTQRKPVVGVAATPEFWRIAIAALRSDPARVAEEMRERCAQLADQYVWYTPGSAVARGIRALRADPLPQEKRDETP